MKKTRFLVCCIALIFLCLIITANSASAQIVWEPQVSNVSVELSWESTGTKNVEIANSQQLVAKLTQHSTVASTTDVAIQCSHNRVGITSQRVRVTLEPNETKETYFTVSNLGMETQEDNVSITVTCYETYLGTETGRDTAYATLLATLIQGQTTLKVKAIGDVTGKPVVGLQIYAIYPSDGQGEQLLQYTDTKGETSFNLQYQAGGAFVGVVKIQTVEDENYSSVEETKTIPNPKTVEAVLVIPEKNPQLTTDEPINWTLVLIVLIVAVTVLVSVALYARSRKQKRTTTNSNSHSSPPPPIISQTENDVYCMFCGTKLPPHAVFCGKCGKKVE